MDNILILAAYMLCILAMLVCVIFTIRKIVLQPNLSPNEFLGLTTILSSQIQSELDAYDKDIFQDKGSITNNNFEQYYHDLTSRIIQNIPSSMITCMERYYTEEAIYRFIARSVRDYLVTKIKGTM